MVFGSVGFCNNRDSDFPGEQNFFSHTIRNPVSEKPEFIDISSSETLMVRLHTEFTILNNFIIEILKRDQIGCDWDYVLGMHLLTNPKDFSHIASNIAPDGMSDKD